jgi:hypothetical protein
MLEHYKEFLRTTLAAGYSLGSVKRIVEWIGVDAERVAALMHVFTQSEYRICQRAAWVVGHVGQKRPHLLEPWLSLLIEQLARTDAHDAIRRNAARVLEEITLPNELLDEAADACFKAVADPNCAVAIRAFSLTTLNDVCQRIPELWPELKLIVEEQLPIAKPAFLHRAKRLRPPKGGEPISFDGI